MVGYVSVENASGLMLLKLGIDIIFPYCASLKRSGNLKMKIKIQAQHLQIGDIVGSGEKIIGIVLNSTKFPSSKVMVSLENSNNTRSTYWGKYTEINVERAET